MKGTAKELRTKLDDCTTQHTVDRELIGGLQATVGMLARGQGKDMAQQIESRLTVAQDKADAVKNGDAAR